MKLAVFYHCLFALGDPPELSLNAVDVVMEQMITLLNSGLEDAASEIIVGINGGIESEDIARLLFPKKAKLFFHGLQSKSENLTLVELEKWLPGHEDFYVLYFHSKGASHDPDTEYGRMSIRWRRCMDRHLVTDWTRCFADLNSGFESVGCHWMTGLLDGTQNIWAGNFWWAKASFLRTVPSIFKRARITMSGISSAESRWESEVWLGNAPRLPRVRDYHPGGIDRSAPDGMLHK